MSLQRLADVNILMMIILTLDIAQRVVGSTTGGSNGTNCLAILNVGKLRTFNWDGVWQSQAAFLPRSSSSIDGDSGVYPRCVDHYLCAGLGPEERPLRTAVEAMNLHVLNFYAHSQLDRLTRCWSMTSFARDKAGFPPYAHFLRTRPDLVFFAPVPWPVGRFQSTLSDADAAVYAPFTDAHALPSYFNRSFNVALVGFGTLKEVNRGYHSSSSSGSEESLPEVFNTDFTNPNKPCCILTGKDNCAAFLRRGGFVEANGDESDLVIANSSSSSSSSEAVVRSSTSRRNNQDVSNQKKKFELKRSGTLNIQALRDSVRGCATISDQLALVPSRFARVYFDPLSLLKKKPRCRGSLSSTTSKKNFCEAQASSASSSTVIEATPRVFVPKNDHTWLRSNCGGWVEGRRVLEAARSSLGVKAMRFQRGGGKTTPLKSRLQQRRRERQQRSTKDNAGSEDEGGGDDELVEEGREQEEEEQEEGVSQILTPEGVLNFALRKAGAVVRPLGAQFTLDPRRLRLFEEEGMTSEAVGSWYLSGPHFRGGAPAPFSGARVPVACDETTAPHVLWKAKMGRLARAGS